MLNLIEKTTLAICAVKGFKDTVKFSDNLEFEGFIHLGGP